MMNIKNNNVLIKKTEYVKRQMKRSIRLSHDETITYSYDILGTDTVIEIKLYVIKPDGEHRVKRTRKISLGEIRSPTLDTWINELTAWMQKYLSEDRQEELSERVAEEYFGIKD